MTDDFDITNHEQCLERMPEQCMTSQGLLRCVSQIGSKGLYAFVIVLMGVVGGKAQTQVVRTPVRRRVRPGLWDFGPRMLPSPEQAALSVYREFYHAFLESEGVMVNWGGEASHRRAVRRLKMAHDAVRLIRGQRPIFYHRRDL